jgi:hypothetical protein
MVIIGNTNPVYLIFIKQNTSRVFNTNGISFLELNIHTKLLTHMVDNEKKIESLINQKLRYIKASEPTHRRARIINEPLMVDAKKYLIVYIKNRFEIR